VRTLNELTDTMTRFKLLAALAAAALVPAWAAAQTPAPAGDPLKGAQKVQMCQGCHGIMGWRTAYPEVYRVPKIGGQHPAYIMAALKEYRSGQRSHPSMDAIAASLTDQDIADVAAYYAALGHPDAPVPAALESPVPQALHAQLATCVACHGANFSSPTDGSIPRLAGQHADYLRAALRAYQVDGNPHYGRKNAVMGAMAKPLSGGDIDAITAYLAALPGELRTVPQPHFK